MSRPKVPQRSDTGAPKGQTYEFLPLDTPNPIRLLHLNIDKQGDLNYTLQHADLDSDPKPIYNCLSYTWGYPQWDKLSIERINFAEEGRRRKTMECDSKILGITSNLESALARLKIDMSTPDPRTGKAVPMWIDSICIHQENNKERSAQVAKMDEIYRHAQKVIVWLGPEDEVYKTKTAIEILERLASIEPENRTANIPAGLQRGDIYTRLGIEPIFDFEWQALGALLMRTWFNRMWVIQETFEAKRVVVYCGNFEIKWGLIVEVSQLLTLTGLGSGLMEFLDSIFAYPEEDDDGDLIYGEEEDEDETSRITYVGNTVNNQWLFQALRDQKKKLKLETLLSYARYFGATGHSDYVYAVRGMWKPQRQEHLHLLETIKPDYDLPVEEVFTAATYASIVEMGDLNILCLVEDTSLRKEREKKENEQRKAELDPQEKEKIKSKRLPSWVPDWSITPIAEALFMNPRPEHGEGRWTASGHLPYRMPPKVIDRQLRVWGFCVMSIAQKARRKPTFEVETGSREIFALLEFLVVLFDQAPSNSMELIDAFWKTIIKNTYREEEAGVEARRALAAFIAVRVFEIEDWVERLRAQAAAEAEYEYDSEDEPAFENELGDKIPQNQEATTPWYETTLPSIASLLDKVSSKDPTNTIPSYSKIRQIIVDGEGDLEFSGANAEDKFFTQAFNSAYIGRRLFSTSKEHDVRLGIGPESLRQGDQVWVVAGMDVPVVLREVGHGKWKLVGECFVGGIMHGEGVKGLDKGDLREVILI